MQCTFGQHGGLAAQGHAGRGHVQTLGSQAMECFFGNPVELNPETHRKGLGSVVDHLLDMEKVPGPVPTYNSSKAELAKNPSSKRGFQASP